MDDHTPFPQPGDDARIALYHLGPLPASERGQQTRARARKQPAAPALCVGEGVTIDLRRADGLVSGLAGRVLGHDATAIRLRVLGYRVLRDRDYLRATKPGIRVVPWSQISALRVEGVEGRRS